MEYFSFTPTEYGGNLTAHTHQTIYWLNRNGYLTNEQTEDLVSRMIVTPIRNNKSFGRRLLNRFFNKDASESVFAFPISLLDDTILGVDDEPESDKPTLKVVK